MGFRPFEVLKEKIRKEELPPGPEPSLCPEEPEEFFQKVKPLSSGKDLFWVHTPKRPPQHHSKDWPPERIQVRVWQTSEYMEGRAPGVTHQLVRQLREGKFAVSKVLDLHGLTAVEAEEALERFFQEALHRGDKCVLVIHGRGLSSPGKPVLKEKVRIWLEKGPYRRYILAYTSARPCDGGPGATYVLLRSKPWRP